MQYNKLFLMQNIVVVVVRMMSTQNCNMFQTNIISSSFNQLRVNKSEVENLQPTSPTFTNWANDVMVTVAEKGSQPCPGTARERPRVGALYKW